MNSWKQASALVNELESDSDKLEVFLQDIWEMNSIAEDLQIPLFIGTVYQFTSGNYFVESLKTLTGQIVKNPYEFGTLRAYVGKTCNYVIGQTVVCWVHVSQKRSNPRELLDAAPDNIYPLVPDASNEVSISKIAKQFYDLNIAPEYSEKLLTIIAKYTWPDDFNSFVAQKTNWNNEINSIIAKKTEAEASTAAIEEAAEKAQKTLTAMQEEKRKLEDEKNSVRSQIQDASSKLSELHNQISLLRKQYMSLFPERYDSGYLAGVRLHIDTPNALETILGRLKYSYDSLYVIEYLIALCTSQIISLCGDPGTGKTTFAREMANALGAKFHLIEVQNNWTDRSDILGFFNPTNGMYQSTPFLDALIEARDDFEENGPDSRLHIICLDEMNLARVEYYFATFLSLLQQDSDKRSIRLLPWEYMIKSNSNDQLVRYQHINIPSNVRFVGTMNMDDTAQHLSPKVIDRCLFIEFSKTNIADKNMNYSQDNSYYPILNFNEIEDPSENPEIDQIWEKISDHSTDQSKFTASPRLIKYSRCMWPLYKTLLPDASPDQYIDLLLNIKVLPGVTSSSYIKESVSNFPDGLAKARFEAGEKRGKLLHPYDDDSWSYWE